MPVHDQSTSAGGPDSLAEAATTALAGTSFGPVEWVTQTGSTNEDLLEAARAGAPHGLVRVADHQSAGRGRRGRTWTTAPGDALLMSVLTRPVMELDELGKLTATFAVAAVEACTALGCPGTAIKWPNDLVVGAPGARRKLAGILAQSQIDGGDVAVVVGLGLNVRTAALGELAAGAVALDELGDPPDRVSLLAEILTRVDATMARSTAAGDGLWGRYRELSATIGTRVRVQLDTPEGQAGGPDVIEGEAVDVTPQGLLVVEDQGEHTEVVVGDVVSLRPA